MLLRLNWTPMKGSPSCIRIEDVQQRNVISIKMNSGVNTLHFSLGLGSVLLIVAPICNFKYLNTMNFFYVFVYTERHSSTIKKKYQNDSKAF